jgi:hypothetical protein
VPVCGRHSRIRLSSGLIAEPMPSLSRAAELDPLSPIIVVHSGRPSDSSNATTRRRTVRG